MPTVTLYPVEDARLYEPNQGAGKSDYLPVGLYSGGIYRSVLRFPNPSWANVKRITATTFGFKQSSQNYVARGGSPRFLVRRLTEGFGDEGSSVSLSTSNNVTWSNKPASTSSGQADTGTLPDVNGDVGSVSILAIMRAWAPTTVENGGGQTNHGIELRSFDEGSTSRTTEIYSKDATTYDPRIVMTYETNTVPLAPTGMSPVSDSSGNPTIGLKTGNYVRFALTRNDPDAGDYLTGIQIQIFADSATDAVPGSVIIDTGKIVITGSPTSTTLDLDVTVGATGGLSVGTTYRWRARTYDREGAAGAWSSLTNARFVPNTAPRAPISPSVDTNSLTPNFYGSISDPDPGATISGAQVQVYQDTSGGAVAKWDDDPDGDGTPYVTSSGTRFVIAYAGSSALEFGVKYRYRSRIRDNLGTWGPWTNWIEWTPTAVTGPTALSPVNVETKLNSLSPTLTIGNGAAFDQYEVEVYRYNDLASTRHYASGTTSVGSTTSTTKVVGPLPDWGRVYYWRARVRPTGGGSITAEAWSPLYPIYVNALPAAPVLGLG